MKVRKRADFVTRDGVVSSSLRSSLSLTCETRKVINPSALNTSVRSARSQERCAFEQTYLQVVGGGGGKGG